MIGYAPLNFTAVANTCMAVPLGMGPCLCCCCVFSSFLSFSHRPDGVRCWAPDYRSRSAGTFESRGLPYGSKCSGRRSRRGLASPYSVAAVHFTTPPAGTQGQPALMRRVVGGRPGGAGASTGTPPRRPPLSSDRWATTHCLCGRRRLSLQPGCTRRLCRR